MTHWCDYRDFAEGLKWLAERGNDEIDSLLSAQSPSGSGCRVLHGVVRPAVREGSTAAAAETQS